MFQATAEAEGLSEFAESRVNQGRTIPAQVNFLTFMMVFSFICLNLGGRRRRLRR